MNEFPDEEEYEDEGPEVVSEPSIPGKKVVSVKNISKQNINVSTGVIEKGDTGECTMAELRSYGKYLELSEEE